MWWIFTKRYKKFKKPVFWRDRIDGIGFGNLFKTAKASMPNWVPRSMPSWLPLGFILIPLFSIFGFAWMLLAFGIGLVWNLLPISYFAYSYNLPSFMLNTTSFEEEQQEMLDGIFYGVVGLCAAVIMPFVVFNFATSLITLALYGVLLPVVTAACSIFFINSGIDFNYEIPDPSYPPSNNEEEEEEEPTFSTYDILSEVISDRVGRFPCWSYDLASSSRDTKYYPDEKTFRSSQDESDPYGIRKSNWAEP